VHSGTPTAVAFLLHVPWDEANRKIRWSLDLLDSDGQPVRVLMNPNEEPQPIHIENEFIVGRPPQVKPGSPINVPFAVNLGPTPLRPDSTFEWVLSIGEQVWRAPFATHPAAKAG
jgi:hypothetical protein